jgi:hypothetical protein
MNINRPHGGGYAGADGMPEGLWACLAWDFGPMDRDFGPMGQAGGYGSLAWCS